MKIEVPDQLINKLYSVRWHVTQNQPMSSELNSSLLEYLGLALGVKPLEPTPDKPAIGYVMPTNSASQPWLVEGRDFPIVGLELKGIENLVQYLKDVKALENMSWSPTAVCMHHTASPALADRPGVGWIGQHMMNLRNYYRNTRKFSAGPHIFTDDDSFWIFNPIQRRGVHAASFNAFAFGIEALGDFDFKDDPYSGRGAASWDHACMAAAALCKVFGLSTSVLFHRDDKLTSKSCPGRKIKKEEAVEQIVHHLEKL